MTQDDRAVFAALILRRLGQALRTGEFPPYRTRLRRSERGRASFSTLLALLLLGLGFCNGST